MNTHLPLIRISCLLTLLLVAFFSTSLSAQNKQDNFSIQFENDLLGDGADRYYTHGFRISRTHEEQRADVLETLQNIADRLPGLGAECAEDIDWLYSFSVGQNIYTPMDLWDPYPIDDDRPYAGWLYFNFGLLSDKRDIKSDCKNIQQLADALDTVELSLGVVGPASQADHVQTFVHDVMDGIPPKGWAHQLKNEPVVNLTYNRQWRLAGQENDYWDFIPHAGFALGTVFTYANAGGTIRVGEGLGNDYGPPRIRPSVPGSDFIKSDHGADLSWYLFAGLEGRAVARNIFLDGNTFEDSHSVDKEPLVGDIQAGAVFSYKDIRLSFTNIFRTREFKNQREPAEFGAVTLTVAF